MKYLALILILNTNIFFHLVYSQGIDEIVEDIYQQTIIHESRLDSLRNYSHVQKIHFIKMDGDGDIEEQSKRDFLVRIRSKDIRHRELISALDFDEEDWVDVTEKERNKRQAESKSVSFSLTEIISPEMRKNYVFNIVGEEVIGSFNTIHLTVKPLEEDEDKFAGDLWFETETFALVQARLRPSDFPTGVETMIMTFSMGKFGEVWLPEKIIFEAEVSFLIRCLRIRCLDCRFGLEYIDHGLHGYL
jgi:hypothetical protein